MTGLLCQTGRNLLLAWTSTSQHVAQPAGMNVTPDKETVVMIVVSRGDDYYTALQDYKAHKAACPVCKEKFPCRKDE